MSISIPTIKSKGQIDVSGWRYEDVQINGLKRTFIIDTPTSDGRTYTYYSCEIDTIEEWVYQQYKEEFDASIYDTESELFADVIEVYGTELDPSDAILFVAEMLQDEKNSNEMSNLTEASKEKKKRKDTMSMTLNEKSHKKLSIMTNEIAVEENLKLKKSYVVEAALIPYLEGEDAKEKLRKVVLNDVKREGSRIKKLVA